MNVKVLFLAGLLLAMPSIASIASIAHANEAFTVQCAEMSETICTVKSDRNIRSVQVRTYSGDKNSSTGFVKKNFPDCPAEVSVGLDYVPPGTKFFVETCDGSNAIRTIKGHR